MVFVRVMIFSKVGWEDQGPRIGIRVDFRGEAFEVL